MARGGGFGGGDRALGPGAYCPGSGRRGRGELGRAGDEAFPGGAGHRERHAGGGWSEGDRPLRARGRRLRWRKLMPCGTWPSRYRPGARHDAWEKTRRSWTLAVFLCWSGYWRGYLTSLSTPSWWRMRSPAIVPWASRW